MITIIIIGVVNTKEIRSIDIKQDSIELYQNKTKSQSHHGGNGGLVGDDGDTVARLAAPIRWRVRCW